MPTIQNFDTYNTFYFHATNFFRQHSAKNSNTSIYGLTMPENSPLYRFVCYFDISEIDYDIFNLLYWDQNILAELKNAAQWEHNVRRIWKQLEGDIFNRWTGNGSKEGEVATGRQGLYLAQERPGAADTIFAELLHYQQATTDKPTTITYYDYRAGHDPVVVEEAATNLRSHFLFNTRRLLKGFNLQYVAIEGVASAVGEIYNLACDDLPANQRRTLEEWYMDDKDASFTRAVGNACLEAGYEYFATTSVRCREEVNIVLNATDHEPIDYLQVLGRMTFYRNANGEYKQAYTIEDLYYNNQIYISPLSRGAYFINK